MRKPALYKWTAIVFAVIFLGACAKKSGDKRERIQGRGTVSEDQSLTQAPGTSSGVTKSDGAEGYWGEIVSAPNTSQAQFQAGVQAFLSNIAEPDGNPINLGTVDGRSNQPTGIWFYGSAGLSGAFNPGGQNSLQVASAGSELRLSIIDSYVGQLNADQEQIKEVPIYLSQASSSFQVTGWVNGNKAQINYKDDMGIIQLQGTFDSNWFTGTVNFQNYTAIQGAPASGSLGVFAIRTCGFFKCP
ncbi:hypothetical protein GW916_00795 [bacterium]|nr:hypothetical protein [bacterium]